MQIRQLYTNCLSEAAYFIASDGVAAVIDPLRDTDTYRQLAEEEQAEIRYIFETHFHADFVSGHLDLAEATGAAIVYGPGTETSFPVHVARDGETFSIGRLTLEVIHTPGHTPESTCYLLRDESGKPYCVFTGDTLFVGGVGRPDLFGGERDEEVMAGDLYASVGRLKQLPDEVIVYPAHGPGSACGKNLGPETQSTIGEQKQSNYAMLAPDKADFIRQVTEGMSTPPPYFPVNARINREGYTALAQVLEKSLKALPVKAFKAQMEEGALVLDTRSPEAFADGFVPGALNIGLDGRFAEWAGSLIPFDRAVLLVTDPGREEETVVRMARVGYDNVAGYLQGGMDAWRKAGEKADLVISVDPDELAMDLPYDPHIRVLDVRKPAEFEGGHVKGAVNLPLETLADAGALADIEERQNLYLHCQSGYRSMIACSLLKREGFHNLRNVTGGFRALEKTKGIEVIPPNP
ncbi:MBL fold metallo-hydrolase [Compostibacter hankyongensis]|uniref:MBL fold metallo-hydrolase n=1 Tax=Compostibacter hankyongensis TaxID=1007089 RepID=A0ABP8FEB0_9BACT